MESKKQGPNNNNVGMDKRQNVSRIPISAKAVRKPRIWRFLKTHAPL